MGGVDNDAGADENGDVGDAVGAVAVGGPEEHVARFGLGAGQMLAEAGVILGLGGARDGVVASCADGVLREAWMRGVSVRNWG